MRNRHIGRIAHSHAEADADDARLLLIERGGFGVDGGQLGGADLVDPPVQLSLGQQGLIDHIAVLGLHGDFGGDGVFGREQIVLRTGFGLLAAGR